MNEEKAAKKAEKLEAKEARAKEKAAEKERIAAEKLAAKEEKIKEKNNKKKNRSRKGLVAFLVVFLLVLGALGGLFYYDQKELEANTVEKNVYFQEKNLGGMTKEQAKAEVDKGSKEILNRPLTLVYGERTWDYTAEGLGLTIDPEALFAEVWQVGRGENIIERYKERLQCYQGKKTIVYEPTANGEVLTPILAAIAEQLGVEAENAYFALDDNGDIYIVPSKEGMLLDTEATTLAIEAALADANAKEAELVVNINAEPETTTADLEAMKINGVLATFSTKYNAGEKDRSYNLWQSCEYMDMTMVKSGETFSFNDTVGERTTARGFRSAIIIENGAYTPGMGGGVCQVSTTLYGALLRTAHLKVTDRQNHSLVSSYVEPGQDAMVAWGSSDLCFENQYSTPILIHATSGGGTITMTIYGDTAYKQEVKLISDVVRYIPYSTETVTDPSLSSGEQSVRSSGKRGLESYLYRKVYEDGVEVSSETVSHDTYKAQTRVVAVGP